MPANAFIGKARKPTEPELAAALGRAKATWDQLLAGLDRDCGANVHEWKSYSRKDGWSLRVKRGEQTVVWLVPCSGSFSAVFVLGERAAQAAPATGLPESVIKMIHEAPNYAEGRVVRLEAKTPKDIGTLKKLASLKLANSGRAKAVSGPRIGKARPSCR